MSVFTKDSTIISSLIWSNLIYYKFTVMIRFSVRDANLLLVAQRRALIRVAALFRDAPLISC
jgi:hypothetical protein